MATEDSMMSNRLIRWIVRHRSDLIFLGLMLAAAVTLKYQLMP